MTVEHISRLTRTTSAAEDLWDSLRSYSFHDVGYTREVQYASSISENWRVDITENRASIRDLAGNTFIHSRNFPDRINSNSQITIGEDGILIRGSNGEGSVRFGAIRLSPRKVHAERQRAFENPHYCSACHTPMENLICSNEFCRYSNR